MNASLPIWKHHKKGGWARGVMSKYLRASWSTMDLLVMLLLFCAAGEEREILVQGKLRISPGFVSDWLTRMPPVSVNISKVGWKSPCIENKTITETQHPTLCTTGKRHEKNSAGSASYEGVFGYLVILLIGAAFSHSRKVADLIPRAWTFSVLT